MSRLPVAPSPLGHGAPIGLRGDFGWQPVKQLLRIRKTGAQRSPDLSAVYVQVPHCLHVCLHRLIIGCRTSFPAVRSHIERHRLACRVICGAVADHEGAARPSGCFEIGRQLPNFWPWQPMIRRIGRRPQTAIGEHLHSLTSSLPTPRTWGAECECGISKKLSRTMKRRRSAEGI